MSEKLDPVNLFCLLKKNDISAIFIVVIVAIRLGEFFMDSVASKRKTISEWILKEIQGGRIPEGKRIPSEYDLAVRFNVNKLTANSAVEELVIRGYLERRPGGGGTVVRFPASHFKGTLAVIMGALEVSYYSRLLCGIQQGAAAYGYNTLLCTSLVNDDPEMTKGFLRMARVDGAIITNFYRIHELDIPVLWVDKNRIPQIPPGFNHLRHNNEAGGRMLARHLLNLGHRKIIYVCQYGNVLLERAQGFIDALAEDSLALLAKEQYFNSGLSARDYVRHLLKRFPEVTAIACDGDNVAFDFYWTLQNMGIKVPRDLSLSGFSSLPEAQRVVKLTTVDEKPSHIGFRAAELLAAVVEKRVPTPIDEIFAVEFVHGDTTGIVREKDSLAIP